MNVLDKIYRSLEDFYLRKKMLWTIAFARTTFCVAEEFDFRETFKRYAKQAKRDVLLVYARVNAKEKFLNEFSVHLNILQYETTVKLESLKGHPNQTIYPHILAKELQELMNFQVQGEGLMVLAIDRVDKLSPGQRNTLAYFFSTHMFPFSIMFILPTRDWDRWSNDYEFKEFLKMTEHKFKTDNDLKIFFDERSKDIVFSRIGNHISGW